MSQHGSPPKPDARVAARVEELLREQLAERGVALRELTPADIATGMDCAIAPDNSMTYYWQNEPIHQVVPERLRADGEDIVRWRMFTRDDAEES
ncbi:MAG: hypothetical protein II543_03865 [Desulfovibrio sp.]|nr:hypothetical protein [Desulfovibrio sp.]